MNFDCYRDEADVKGFIWACVLLTLSSPQAVRAYEGDIHFSATYVLARAAGWPEADALTIASANEGVDANPETVAALEMDTIPGASLAGYVTSSLHQAEQNFGLHCFSGTNGPADRVSDDVLEVISGHFARVPDRDADPRKNARGLIALGVALHCQQDAFSHVSFGGSCGSYAGSCYGHTYRTFLDGVLFGVLKKHYFDPDHPGVSGQGLLNALQETARELAAHRPMAAARPIPIDALNSLADALRTSGLELPDAVRRECNRLIAGKWLADFLRSIGAQSRDSLRTLAPQVAGDCGNESLASATVVSIPEPRFPRLDADASPTFVRADGTYEQVAGGDLAAFLPGLGAASVADLIPELDAQKLKLQLSHWSQLLALPLIGQWIR